MPPTNKQKLNETRFKKGMNKNKGGQETTLNSWFSDIYTLQVYWPLCVYFFQGFKHL